MTPEDFIVLLTVIMGAIAIFAGVPWWLVATVGGLIFSLFLWSVWVVGATLVVTLSVLILPQPRKPPDHDAPNPETPPP